MSWKRPPARPAKQFEGEVRARDPAPSTWMAEAMGSAPPIARPALPSRVPPTPSAMEARGRKIRESARGEECSVRYVGICSHDPAKTIWSHARWGARLGAGGRGMGDKADDIAGAYACTRCDAAYDGQLSTGMTREALDLDWCMGHFRSLAKLQRKGIL